MATEEHLSSTLLDTESAYYLAYYVLHHQATFPLIKELAEWICSELESRFVPEQTEKPITNANKTIEEITDQIMKISK